MSTSRDRPLAVVTGGSSGIGLALAHQFAGHGFDLIVAAEDVADVAHDLRSGSPAKVTAVKADLSDYHGVELVWDEIRHDGRPVSALALNAGAGLGGDFVRDQKLKDVIRLVRLNVESTVHLAKRVLPDMVARGAGRVLVTSSIASETPGPYQAVYNASKSFVQSFAEGLRDELRGTGVTVTALMPGPTDTRFFARAGLADTKLGTTKKDDPELVAAQGFEALMDGRARVHAGRLMSRLQGTAMKVMPDAAKAVMHRVQAPLGLIQSASREPAAAHVQPDRRGPGAQLPAQAGTACARSTGWRAGELTAASSSARSRAGRWPVRSPWLITPTTASPSSTGSRRIRWCRMRAATARTSLPASTRTTGAWPTSTPTGVRAGS
jgi:short-subunit dehydrogenase